MLDIDWTDHAEYRGDLRDIDPDEMNEDIRDWIRERLQKKGPDRKKVRMKTPEGTAVVDFDTTQKPSDADVITVWGSREARIAEIIAADPKYNLQGKYRYWNAKAFGGELPPIPIKWMRSKTMGGRVRATLSRSTGDITLKNMAISNYLVMDEERLDGIMLHEMVHVYVLGVLGLAERSGGHGREFYKKMREVSSKTGIHVPVTEDITGLEISEDVPTKPIGVVLAINNAGKKVMQVFNVRSLIRSSREIPERLEALGYKWFAILQVKDRELMKFPEQRKFGRKWWLIDSSEMNRIMGGEMVLIDEGRFQTASTTARRTRKKRKKKDEDGQFETLRGIRKKMPPPTRREKRKDRKTRQRNKELLRRDY
jgi:hypothetical protein